MSEPGFLFDENLSPTIARQLMRREPQAWVYVVGEPKAPGRGTLDPDLLDWIEAYDCLLVTNNRTSMPKHLEDHLAGGRHVRGILVTPFPLDIGGLMDDLLLIWGASRPEDFCDQIVYLPLRR